MSEALDYSSGWPRDLGNYVGTIRYIGTPRSSKNLTRAELDYRREHGTPTAYVYESTAGWMFAGYDAGTAAGRAIVADLVTLGVPLEDCPLVYAACDKDVSSSQLAAIDDCLRGMAFVLGSGRVGVYGEADVIDHCVGRTARLGWQTRAWSGGRVSTKACLLQQVGYVQVDGVQCDRNTILLDDWGQGDDDMTPEEHDWLFTTRKLIADINHKVANVLEPKVNQALAALDTVKADTFAAAVVAALPPGNVTGLSKADIEAVVRAAAAAVAAMPS